MHITIYSTSTCSTCNALTRWLTQHGQSYEKKITDEDPDAMAEFMSINDGNIGVPFTVLSDGNGTSTKIVGFNQALLKEALGL